MYGSIVQYTESRRERSESPAQRVGERLRAVLGRGPVNAGQCCWHPADNQPCMLMLPLTFPFCIGGNISGRAARALRN